MGKRLDFMLFPGGKNRAMTFSYDDGVVQDRRLVELFNRYHVKGTFNLNTATLGIQARGKLWRQAYGHLQSEPGRGGHPV